ncbi:hypothetical protein [Notoacmeibacter sp. MSK16QG-6]|uniref:hypothetical protein n=1 Tax=Notoacmeibacter sp. MSK16QG-6 TaxID=2957982 RepID=UPI0020A08A3D|nr:hypothetical protein [Notoacmeibacter sp. MSK16QG-6]MCP1197831.1 hypothetical protein [Notoacmeibacter sp. MSK16QG-6]
MSSVESLHTRLAEIDRLIEEARSNAARDIKEGADHQVERDLADLVKEREALLLDIETQNGAGTR